MKNLHSTSLKMQKQTITIQIERQIGQKLKINRNWFH